MGRFAHKDKNRRDVCQYVTRRRRGLSDRKRGGDTLKYVV